MYYGATFVNKTYTGYLSSLVIFLPTSIASFPKNHVSKWQFSSNNFYYIVVYKLNITSLSSFTSFKFFLTYFIALPSNLYLSL